MRRIRYRTRTLGRVTAPGSIPITYDSPLHSPRSLRKKERVLSKVEHTGSKHVPLKKALAVIESLIVITT